MAPQGLFEWPGASFISGSYSIGHGVSPGIATLVCVPGGNPAVNGTLLLSYGGVKIAFQDCRLVDVALSVDMRGEYRMVLHIADGRWRWQFGRISALYNKRLPNGEIDSVDPKTIRSARTIAKEIFKEMGVDKYDVTALPDDEYPFFDWEYERPDSALSSLCDRFGVRVVYCYNGYVKLCETGVGNPLPLGPDVLDNSLGVDPSEMPDSIIFAAGRTAWQHDFELEPVGRERDGSIVPVEKLSYKPATGWGSADLKTGFVSIRENDPQAGDLAAETVYKWYRIKSPITAFGGTFRLWQILPMYDFQLQEAIFSDGEAKHPVKRPLPAWAFGQYYVENPDAKPNTSILVGDLQKFPRSLVFDGYSVDTKNGIVRFGNPKYLYDNNGLRLFAKMRLRAAFSARDPATRQFVHWEKKVSTGVKFGTKPLYRMRGDMSRKIYRDLDGILRDNVKEVDDYATEVIDGVKRELETKTPGTITYGGFRPIMLDGAIQQVRYWVTDQGQAFTQASRQNEIFSDMPGYQETRFNQIVSAWVAQQVRENSNNGAV